MDIPGLEAPAGAFASVCATGKWANPHGWRPRWMWTGDITIYPGIATVVRPLGGVDERGVPRAKRVQAPAHLRRERRAPNLVCVRDLKEYQQKRDPKHGGWVDAVKDLPDEYREMLLDCYAEDMTPALREICAEQIKARDAAAQKKAAARPVATERRHGDVPAAGRAKAPKPVAKKAAKTAKRKR